MKIEGSAIRQPGIFGRFMSRDEFRDIVRILDFDNPDSKNSSDRHWRVRMVINILSKQFFKAITLGSYLSFDEATFAYESSFLPSRVFNKLKRKRFGLKIFMTCCIFTGFCAQFSVFQSKKKFQLSNHGTQDGPLQSRLDKIRTDLGNHEFGTYHNVDAHANNALGPVISDDNRHNAHDAPRNSNDGKHLDEDKCGPSAMYNCLKIFADQYKVIFSHRFYNSVSLFMRLARISIFALGTIGPSRLGYPEWIIINLAKRNVLKRGDIVMAQTWIEGAKKDSKVQLLVVGWMDTTTVQFIATGIGNMYQK